MLVSADLSQIEIIIAAQLSRDRKLIELLNAGKDMHRFLVSNIYNEPEDSISKDDPRRRDAKSGTFGILYGNGAGRLSKSTGRDITWAKEFINTFYTLFPDIKQWHDQLIKTVESTGQITTFTGRIYRFKSYAGEPEKFHWQKKGIQYYRPQDIKNYPVQGTARDIFGLWIGQLFRENINCRDKWLLVNNIHDEVMLDCKDEFGGECVGMLKKSVDILPELVYNTWQERLVVPIKCEIVKGYRWSEME